MKSYVFVLITAFLVSTINGFFLRKLGEDLHNIANSVIPHEHRILPFGKPHQHHHDDAIDYHHHPDDQHGPPHRCPHHPDRPHFNGPEPPRFDGEGNINGDENGDGNNNGDLEPLITTSSTAVEEEEVVTTPASEQTEEDAALVMPIDVRSAPDISSRRLINPGSNCGDGQKADGRGRCRAVFG